MNLITKEKGTIHILKLIFLNIKQCRKHKLKTTAIETYAVLFKRNVKLFAWSIEHKKY